MSQFVRCFTIGDRVEYSYDREEDLRRMYPTELPWADIDETKRNTSGPGISIFRLSESSLVIWTSVEGGS
jgi:hypothetical protein